MSHTAAPEASSSLSLLSQEGYEVQEGEALWPESMPGRAALTLVLRDQGEEQGSFLLNRKASVSTQYA